MRTLIFLLMGLTVRTALTHGCCDKALDFSSLEVEAQQDSDCCHGEGKDSSDSHTSSKENKSHCSSACCGSFLQAGAPTFKTTSVEYEVSKAEDLSVPEIHLAIPIRPPIA